MKSVFQTCDGELFEDCEDAKEHEDGLFEEWLAKNPSVKVDKLLAYMDDTTSEEYHGTEDDIMRLLLREYWT